MPTPTAAVALKRNGPRHSGLTGDCRKQVDHSLSASRNDKESSNTFVDTLIINSGYTTFGPNCVSKLSNLINMQGFVLQD